MGTLRSGKTLVSRALNMHPNISLQVEPYFFFFKICRNIFHRDILKSNLDLNRPISAGFYADPADVELFKNEFLNIQFHNNDIDELIKMTIWQQESEKKERAPQIISLLHDLRPGPANIVLINLMKVLARAYPKKELKYVGFSEGWCDEFVAPLMDDINFKCINIIRDPRAVIASRNYGKKMEEEYGGKYPILFLIRHWRKSVAYSIINDKNPNFLSIKYEDLVRKPEYWFNIICKHIGVPMDKVLLQPDKYINGNNELWKQNTNFESGSGFSTTAINRWKKILPKQDMLFIDWMCKPEMKYCGYESDFTGGQLGEIVSYRENNDDIVKWLRSYNLSVTESEIQKEVTRRHLLTMPEEYVSKLMMGFYFYNDHVYHKLQDYL